MQQSITSESVPSDVAEKSNPPEQLAHPRLLADLIEDAEAKREILLKIDAIQDISQAEKKVRRERIKYWAKQLGKSPRTIDRWVQTFRKEGWSVIVHATRSNKGMVQGRKSWKPNTKYWVTFIEKTYKDGNRHSRRMNRNQVYNQVKAHAILKLGLKDHEYPSNRFVYMVLDPLVNKPKVRHPGQGPGLMIQTTEETIIVERSNQVWQIDHTDLDVLLTNHQYEVVGRPYFTALVDSYSGCALGYYLSFKKAGSHEVALALRHAILRKTYGQEVKLQNNWETFGLPEYIVTDRANEFKSVHLKQIASELGIKLRYRAYPEQGGIIESLFDKNNKELLSQLPGYTGSNVQKRPANAEKYACIFYEELTNLITKYLVDHYNHHCHPKANHQTRNQRWWAGLPGQEPRTIDVNRLDICLMKTIPRKVQKRGTVLFECLAYQSDWLEEYQGQYIVLRYDPRNVASLLVFSLETEREPSKFLGTVKARDYEGEYLVLADLKETKKRYREEGKAIDQTSILKERRSLNQFSQRKIKTLKQHRKEEKKRINRISNPPNIIDLVPRIEASTERVPQKAVSPVENSEQQTVASIQGQQTETTSNIIAFDWNTVMNDT